MNAGAIDSRTKDPRTADARTRLPREPYPGLRPFLDFEAALLFGRERQVKEVIQRLQASQFVAVLGGSGSGKSSLIHAGVVPELRSFGIPGAGDLWLPMTCTPGTNVGADDRAARRVTPITRLARRFEQLLVPLEDAAAAARRLGDIAEVFRQETGFSRLLEVYGGQLAVPPGPDPAEARVIFVLDQFEELFHPTNKGVEDATLLVERVLDHFFNPHPHCHVILTMRSEHLNDCAAFLELPDAINKSSYLVRRLDDDEVRQAITGPAQRFLRLMARSEPSGPAARVFPPEVAFEPAVIERLLRDVKAITHDPDHLPLLQHLLARLWESALAREELDMPVPSHVTEIDLVRAVTAGRPGDEQPLDDKLNTLRACVENWPETLYGWHGPEQRLQLDELFRQLAFKDPNTGMYSQQRVPVDAAVAQLGPGRTRTDLRSLIAEGFLGSVDYLYWDDDDPERVTLKVSHESFIRGWSRFRRLIDEESEHFDEFVGVLRRCAVWQAGGRSEDLLLESGEMRLLRQSGFPQRLATPGQQAAWFRLLQIDRDGARLGKLEPELGTYLDLSAQRLRAREQQVRSRRVWRALSAFAVLLLPPAFFSLYVQAPVTERAGLLLEAGTAANRAQLTPDYPGVGAAADPLAALVRAAELVDDARTGNASRLMETSEWLLDRLEFVGPVAGQRGFLDAVGAQAEPPVNGKLRQLLSSAVWPGVPLLPGDARATPPDPRDGPCDPAPGVQAPTGPTLGRLFPAPGGTARPAPEARPQRGLFVPVYTGEGATSMTLHGATYDPASGRCSFGPPVISIPLLLNPRVVLDATLRYVAYTAEGPLVEEPSVTVDEIDWERGGGYTSRAVTSTTRTVLTGRPAVEAVKNAVVAAAGAAQVAVVPSWRAPGGRVLGIGARGWRLVSPMAQRLLVPADEPAFELLQPAAPGSPCQRLAQAVAVFAQPGFEPAMYADARHCWSISRGRPPLDPAASPDPGARSQLLVAMYAVPGRRALEGLKSNPPAPLASVALFARVDDEREWRVGMHGAWAGWLAVRGRNDEGTDRLLAAPMSTCALWRLARELPAPGTPLATPARADHPGYCEGR